MSTVAQYYEKATFREAIDTFKSLLSKEDVQAATSKWDQIAVDYPGQIELLEAAKVGDITAVNFLYLKLIPQITSVFWNNFLGKDAGHRRRRIAQGDQFEFASMVYQSMLSAAIQSLSADDAIEKMKGNMADLSSTQTDTFEDEYQELMGAKSPLLTFDPKVFDTDTNLIDKFGYYLMGALKNEATKYNRKERRSGITGNKQKNRDDVQNVSFDSADFDNMNLDADHINYSSFVKDGNDFHGTEDLDAWEQFTYDDDLDSGRYPTTRDVLKDFLAQEDKFDVNEVAAKHSATNQTIRNRLAGMADILERHGLDQSSFLRLLKDHGGEELSTHL